MVSTSVRAHHPELPPWAPAVFAMFPFLEHGDPALRRAFFEQAQHMSVPAGKIMCIQGQHCGHLALLLEGKVRVYKMGEEGREVTLYRVGEGDSCILSAACILSGRAFPAFALTETPVETVTIPSEVFRGWADGFADWRHYIFSQLTRRLIDVIDVLEDVTFGRLDARLATYLLAAMDDGDGRVARTHQAIAADLGTSREVVSRLLKDFERRDLVKLSRGVVRVIDIEGVRDCSARHPL